MNRLLLFFFVFCNNINYAQPFYNKTIDVSGKQNLFSRGELLESDSILYLNGISLGVNFNYELIVYKVNTNNGDTIWTRTITNDSIQFYSGSGNTIIDLNNQVIICGRMDSAGTVKPFLTCYSKNGTQKWFKSINNGSANSGFAGMFFLNNKLYIGGYKSVGSNVNYYLAICDTIGNILNEFTYGNSSDEAINNIDLTIDSCIVLGGLREISGPVWQGYVVKADTLGNFMWENLLSNNTPVRVKSLSNGKVLAYTATRNASDNFSFCYSAILDNFNNGSIIIDKSFIFDETHYSELSDAIEINNFLYFIGSAHYFAINNPAGILLKTNMNLDSLTSRWYTKRNNDHYLNSILQASNGDLIMTGYIFPDSIVNTEDGWLLRTNCIGALEPPLATASLNFSEANLTEQISLINQSTEFESSITDWGDFTSDTIFSPNDSLQTHLYNLPGQYEVTVTAIACNDTSAWQTTLTILPKDYDNGLTVFPNPTNGNLNIWCNSQNAFQLSIYDASGRLVMFENIIENIINHGYNINLSTLSNGVYLLNLVSETENLQVKVLKSE